MMSKKDPKKANYLKVLTIALTIVMTMWIIVYFKTIQVFEFVSDSTLSLYGVERAFRGDFETFEQDHCVKGKSCSCVLLVHGLGDAAYTWHNALVESSVSYKKPIKLYAVNLPGSLNTPLLESDDLYKPKKLAERLSKSFLPLCKNWVLSGNSYGGWLVTLMAKQIQEGGSHKVASLVLTAPAGLKKDYSHVLNYFTEPSVESAKSFYKKTYFHTIGLPDFVFLRIAERAKKLPILSMLKSIADDDYLDGVLAHNKIPARLLWGDSDNVILTSWGEEFHSKMNNSSLRIVENCGHIPQRECFDAFLQELNLALDMISP